MATALLIRNPTSRATLPPDVLAAVEGCARDNGWAMASVITEHPGHATVLARAAAARDIGIVVVNGGDGTINETINGLANTRTALAVLPGGTANVWAREIRMPRDPVSSMRALMTGERRRVDLGRTGGRYFLLMAGLGLDGKIVPCVTPRLKRRFGALAYVIAGIPAAFATKPWRTHMMIDGSRIETQLYWAVLGNTRLYGGFREVTHRAIADDAQLDLALMHRGGPFHLAVDGLRLMLAAHDRSPNVTYRRLADLEIATPGIPVQLDGEYHGETPMRFGIAPLALTVIVPAGLTTPLFAGPAAPGAPTGP